MKILYIYKSIALLAGMERVLTDKMNYLSDQLGYDVYLITYEQGLNPLSYFLSSRIEYVDLGVLLYTKNRYKILKRIWVYLSMRREYKYKLYKEVERIEPDIIISTNYSYPLLDIIINSPGNRKYIFETHISKNALLKAEDFARYSPLRYVVRFYDYYMLRQIRRCNILVTLTEQDKNKWENELPVTVIPNVLTNYPETAASLDNKTIISVGRLDPQKGYDLLIQVWEIVSAKHPDWEIHIYGNGPCKGTLQNQIKEAGLDSSFILYDATPYIYEKYMDHSIYVMSSRFEGFGLVLIEAMSCGLPCVSFDCLSGPSEIIKNGEDGILVENGNMVKLSDAICRLIENKNERKLMGKNARKNILRYSKDVIMQRWDTLFRELS